LSLITAYQTDPANPLPVGALLGALDRMIRYITRTYADALGGYADARQDVYAALLGVCKKYDLTKDTGVEMHLLGDTANALASKVNRGIKDSTKEVHLDELPAAVTMPPSMRKVDLERAIAAKIVTEYELKLLRWRHHDELSWETIAKRLKTTDEAARKKVNRIAEKLKQWGSARKTK